MKHHDYMTGYKATDKDMRCQGFQFELGKWYKHEGDVKLCHSGFHFCVHPSGPWSYYYAAGTRVFKVEAKDAYEEYTPGADLKIVCREIRITEELHTTGDGNTGDSNTGNWNTGDNNTGHGNTGYGNTGYNNTGHRNTGDNNTGDGNTGYRNTGYNNTGHRNTGDNNTGYRNTGDNNTGDGNTGYRNTGDNNTGDGNTGDGNTGYRNTGDNNTGHGNTGYGNTGHRNTGHRNTGYGNTGDNNTGDGNATNRSGGFFCAKEPCVMSFDKQTKLTYDQYLSKYPNAAKLGELLQGDSPFVYLEFKNLPGWTLAKCKALHKKHIKGRKAKESR